MIYVDDDIDRELKEEWHISFINKSLMLHLEYGILPGQQNKAKLEDRIL